MQLLCQFNKTTVSIDNIFVQVRQKIPYGYLKALIENILTTPSKKKITIKNDKRTKSQTIHKIYQRKLKTEQQYHKKGSIPSATEG